LELPIIQLFAAILERCLADGAESAAQHDGCEFSSPRNGAGHVADIVRLNSEFTEKGGARFWFHGLRNAFITVAERELILPRSLTKRLVNHVRPGDVTEGYAADRNVVLLHESAQCITDRIDGLMKGTCRRPAVRAGALLSSSSIAFSHVFLSCPCAPERKCERIWNKCVIYELLKPVVSDAFSYYLRIHESDRLPHREDPGLSTETKHRDPAPTPSGIEVSVPVVVLREIRPGGRFRSHSVSLPGLG